MPAYDYSKPRATADRLITRFGRPIRLLQWANVPADVNEPWRGPAPLTGDAPNLVENSQAYDMIGVFIPPAAVRIFDLAALGEATEYIDLLRMSEQLIITYPGDVDVTLCSRVVSPERNNDQWGITATQVLRPGPDIVLAFIGVRR